MITAGLLYLSVGACNSAGNAEPDAQPTVYLAISMSEADLLKTSTYPFARDARIPNDGDFGYYIATELFDLQLENNGQTFVWRHIGGPYHNSIISIRTGKVRSFAADLQTEKLSLDEALERGQSAAEGLKSIGFKMGPEYTINNWNKKKPKPTIYTFGEAKPALQDEDAFIAEMTLFVGSSEDADAVVRIASGDRMLRAASVDKSPRYDPPLVNAWNVSLEVVEKPLLAEQ